MINKIKNVIQFIRLWFWVRKYGKPFRTNAPYNAFEKMALKDIQSTYPDSRNIIVSWDQVAWRELKAIVGYRPEVGTYEWWEDSEDNPKYVSDGATPGFCIRSTQVPFPEKWKTVKGGYFIPAYVEEYFGK